MKSQTTTTVEMSIEELQDILREHFGKPSMKLTVEVKNMADDRFAANDYQATGIKLSYPGSPLKRPTRPSSSHNSFASQVESVESQGQWEGR